MYINHIPLILFLRTIDSNQIKIDDGKKKKDVVDKHVNGTFNMKENMRKCRFRYIDGLFELNDYFQLLSFFF